MARLARAEIFDPSEVAIVHVMARTVRRCFLLGFDPVTSRNYDHRKDWIEEKLKHLAAFMGIDLLSYALMSNHFHLILRSRPDAVANWSDEEVARRWLSLCPIRKRRRTDSCEISLNEPYVVTEPSQADLNSICNNPRKLSQIRIRLSDISWWMRLLCQNIAQRANREEGGGGLGKFWQSRFKAVRILDEASLLACSSYVDLNPIRAAIAEKLEDTQYNSARRRIDALYNSISNSQSHSPDGFLAPISIDESKDPTGIHSSSNLERCSDKGYLPMASSDYLELLDWTARQLRMDQPGCTPNDLPPILERLGMELCEYIDQVRFFGAMFSDAAGKPQSLAEARTLRTHRRFYVRHSVRRVLAACL
jgi:REP element-mobilizing transposase RayT